MGRSVPKDSRPLSGLQREIEKFYIKMKHLRYILWHLICFFTKP